MFHLYMVWKYVIYYIVTSNISFTESLDPSL